MLIKKKIWLAVFAATFLIYTAGGYCLQRFIIMPSFLLLERQEAEKDFKRCLNAITNEINHLNQFCKDWATWDDSYRFVQDGNKSFIESNLEWETLESASGLNLVYFYNSDGTVVWGQGYDSTLGGIILIKQYPIDEIENDIDIFHDRLLDPPRGGIILTNFGPMLVSSQPILTSDGKGSSRGSLIMGRFFNEQLLTKLTSQTSIDFSINAIQNVKLSKSLQNIISRLRNEAMIFKEIDQSVLSVYGFVHEIGGKPALLLTANLYRNIMAQGRKSSRLIMVFLFITVSTVIITFSAAAIFYVKEEKKVNLALKESTERLRRAEKMETIGTLAGGVAHDLNNILGAIVGYPDLLLQDISEDSPLRCAIITIKKSGERAAAVVQDLLTLARRGVIVSDVVNLNDVVVNYFETREYIKLRELQLDFKVKMELEEDLRNIIGSPVHLSKIVMNLVSNAAEALPGCGEIAISTENRHVAKRIKGYDSITEGDYVTLVVKDDGIGISSEHLEKIFEPFYTKKIMGREGTGLGMAVVWGTVKDHQGYIDVKSTVGKGTTFTLYFPVTEKEAENSKQLVSIEEYIGNGEKILVVDDIKLQRDLAVHLLEKLNYSVEAASSGEQAIEYMRKQTADLLVLDMIMDPGIGGLETYKRILKIRQGQKVIIASGLSKTADVQQAQKLGAGKYIQKPYTLEKIGLAVKEALEK